ncbi:MAG: NFACT family protein [Clostridia bacterium]|nr:NFACT family protein [Clostridia bacterium]
MAFDGLFCAAVAQELNNWAGARIEKIHQSSQNCFYFQVYRDGKRGNFVISASAPRPILAITEESVARPDTPTPTCMLYRKHLQNGRFIGAEWVENERIIRFVFDSADEMGYIKRKFIYAEMMGKYSNIILTDDKDKILSAGSVSDITAGVRQIMVGLPYEFPPRQDKISMFAIDDCGFLALCKEKSGMVASEFLLRNFYGFSPVVAREVAFNAFGSSDIEINETNANVLLTEFNKLKNRFADNDFVANAVFDKDGNGIEYSYMPLTQYGSSFDVRIYDNFSTLLTDYFGRKEEAVNIGRYSREITKTVSSHLSRAQKKLVILKNELKDCSAMEEMRIKGDVITANIYRIRQGDDSVTGMDYESGVEVTIPLDVSLSPAKNAQKYYKKYSKMKRASVMLAEQIKKTEAECNYLEGVLGFIERAASPNELNEIKIELAEGGYLNDKTLPNGKKKKTPASKPLSFTTTDGLLLRVGRNNRQNDALTGNADRNELWFHIKGFHGSHVILTPNGLEEPSDRDYTEAAMVAAYYSEKRGSSNVEVDYTRVRNLKKPSGSAPGFVTYEKYYSAVVDAINPYEK